MCGAPPRWTMPVCSPAPVRSTRRPVGGHPAGRLCPQNQQQEKLSTQAYILSESLTAAASPSPSPPLLCQRLHVLRVLGDYDQRSGDEVLTTWPPAEQGRPGPPGHELLLRRRPFGDRSLLLVLSDASPQRRPGPSPSPACPWEATAIPGNRGIADTAAEAARLRAAGVTPVCIFTGTDREVPAAAVSTVRP